MTDTITIDDSAGPGQGDPPAARRSERRAIARRARGRRALATTAGIGVVATIAALVALPSSGTPPATVHLPSATAANAAFTSGLLAGGAGGLLGGGTTSMAAAPAIAAAPTAVHSAVPAAQTNAVAVTIQNYAFSPATITIAAGTTVTWKNMDVAPHTVTVSSGPVKFSSPDLQTGDTYTYTFDTAGTYSYYCAVHPNMTAKVVVTGSTSSSTPPSSSPPSSSPPSSTPPSSTPPSSSGPAPTTSMSMSTPPADSSTCAVSTGLQTLLTHVNVAHLGESPGQQVNDILNVDQYIGNHLALVENILGPLTNGGLTNAISGLLQTLLTHVNVAHLDESPAQQANDILNINTYIGNHLALVANMLSSTEALLC